MVVGGALTTGLAGGAGVGLTTGLEVGFGAGFVVTFGVSTGLALETVLTSTADLAQTVTAVALVCAE